MQKVSEIVDAVPHISVITQIEVLRFNDTPDNEKILSDFVASSIIHPLTDAVAKRSIALGKQSKIKLPDAIIAATALETGFVLVTRNIADFKNVPGLNILNPWDLP